MQPARRNDFLAAVHQRPVIAAARTMEDAREAAESRVAAVFVLGGSILTLPEMTAALRAALGEEPFAELKKLDAEEDAKKNAAGA